MALILSATPLAHKTQDLFKDRVEHLNHHCRNLYMPSELDVATYTLAIIHDGEPLRTVRGDAHKLAPDGSLACMYTEDQLKTSATTVFGNLVEKMSAPADATDWTKKYGVEPLPPYQYKLFHGQ